MALTHLIKSLTGVPWDLGHYPHQMVPPLHQGRQGVASPSFGQFIPDPVTPVPFPVHSQETDMPRLPRSSSSSSSSSSNRSTSEDVDDVFTIDEEEPKVKRPKACSVKDFLSMEAKEDRPKKEKVRPPRPPTCGKCGQEGHRKGEKRCPYYIPLRFRGPDGGMKPKNPSKTPPKPSIPLPKVEIVVKERPTVAPNKEPRKPIRPPPVESDGSPSPSPSPPPPNQPQQTKPRKKTSSRKGGKGKTLRLGFQYPACFPRRSTGIIRASIARRTPVSPLTSHASSSVPSSSTPGSTPPPLSPTPHLPTSTY